METAVSTAFSERFEAIKQKFKLRNSDLARLGGVTDAAIGKIMRGQTHAPDVAMLINLVKKLNLSTRWILLGEGDMMDEYSYADSDPVLKQKLRTRDQYIADLIGELGGKFEGVFDEEAGLVLMDLEDDGIGGKLLPLFGPRSSSQDAPLFADIDLRNSAD